MPSPAITYMEDFPKDIATFSAASINVEPMPLCCVALGVSAPRILFLVVV